MGFLAPKVPKPTPQATPANPAIQPPEMAPDGGVLAPSAASLISTSTQGLRRRASTQRRSLIGGI